MRDYEEIWRNQKVLFFNSASKEYIQVSDGAELLLHSTKKSDNDLTILFLSGYSAVPSAWNDLWDELFNNFNLIYLETREKSTSKLDRTHNCDLNRISLDIKEVIHKIGLIPEKTVLIAVSIATVYLARVIADNLISPKGIILIEPFRTPRISKTLTFIAKLFPNWVVQPFIRTVIKMWIRTFIPKGIELALYKKYIDTLQVNRMRKQSPMIHWDSTDDFKKIKCPTWVISAEEDFFHSNEKVEEICKIIRQSHHIKVPSFAFMRFNPGASEFAKTIKKIMKSLEDQNFN